MLSQVPPTECMQAREGASARLDGELSELESARLDAHLLGCAECRAFLAGIATASEALRRAPLDPAPTAFVVARRRRLAAAPVAAAAAAAVLAIGVAAGASFLVGQQLAPTGGSSLAASTAARTGPAAARTQLDPGLVAMLRIRLAPRRSVGRVVAV